MEVDPMSDERERERAQPLCAACGWAKDRGHPERAQEPPIVAGALDAQGIAEGEMFKARQLAEARRHALLDCRTWIEEVVAAADALEVKLPSEVILATIRDAIDP